MLTFNLTPFFRMRGVSQPRQFLIGLGINHVTARKLLKGEMTSLRLEHIEKICEALRCTPNDLLEWEPNKSSPLDKEHPLHGLAPRKNLDRLFDKIGRLSAAELEKLVGEL